MGFGDLLWLFFMISALQPVIRQKMLEVSRLRLLRRLEQQRKSRVIALVHRQETLSFLGFPIVRYIDINDSEEILRAIKLTDPDTPIDLIIHTPGGLVLAAGQIAHALRRHRAKVTVFVPHHAMSGGTLISLAANEIVMDPNAVLGPVDPQLGEAPAASILSVTERKKPEDIEDKTLILADVSRKAIVQLHKMVQELLGERMARDAATTLAGKLTTGTWTHDYGIFSEEAKELGLPVSTDMPEDVYDFMALFPQPTRLRSAVEYVPMPYRGARQGR
jgi:ClpP class serine protease